MSNWNFVLSWVEHEKKFYNLEAWLCCLEQVFAWENNSRYIINKLVPRIQKEGFNTQIGTWGMKAFFLNYINLKLWNARVYSFSLLFYVFDVFGTATRCTA